MLHTTKCDWSKIFVMYIKRIKNICRNLNYFGTHSNIMTNLNYTVPHDSHLRTVKGKEYEKHKITLVPKYNLTGVLDLDSDHLHCHPCLLDHTCFDHAT